MSLKPYTLKARKPKGSSRSRAVIGGGWGSRRRQFGFTKKKIGFIIVLVLLSLMFFSSKISPLTPVFADYNTSFSHTRTLIFGDTQFNGPTGGGSAIAFKSKVNASLSGMSVTLPGISVTSADTIVLTMIGSNAFDFGCSVASTIAITDSQTNTYTLRVQSPDVVGGGANTCIYTAPVGATGTDTITVSTAPHNEVWQSITAIDFSGSIGFGSTGSLQKVSTLDSDSSTVTMTIGSTSSVTIEAFELDPTGGGTTSVTTTSGQTIRNSNTPATAPMLSTSLSGVSGSSSFTFSWSVTPAGSCLANCRTSHSALELTSTITPVNTSQVRWNFNSTCVTFRGPTLKEVDFDWTKGTAGSGGSNCNSANVMISKSQVNFQTAAGRDLEIIWQAASLNTSNTQSVDVVFRTNSTLPSFTENYNPFNDTNARLIYEACTRFSTVCGGSGQTVYIQHDPTKNIFTETRTNDFVVSGATPDFRNNGPVYFQAVLNFTGPINYINEQTSISTTNNSNNTASGLQMGESYNILVKVNTIGAPQGVLAAEFTNSFGAGPNGIPAPFTIWSVPPSCADPLNRVACGLSAPQPVFQFNPLDPSSWGNAIIQGLVWVFSVALPQGLLIIFAILINFFINSMNFVGNQLGFGSVGTYMSDFINQAIIFFTSFAPTLESNIAAFFGRFYDTLTITFPWLPNALNIAFLVLQLGISGIPRIVSILGLAFQLVAGSYAMIIIIFWFQYTGDFGLDGGLRWFETVKWLIFGLGVRWGTIGFNLILDIVTAIMSLLPKPIINIAGKIPRIPIIEVHSNPSWPSFDMFELRSGNLWVFLLWVFGFNFFVWFESQSPALPGSLGAVFPSTLPFLTPMAAWLPLLNIMLVLSGAITFIFLIIHGYRNIGLTIGQMPVGRSVAMPSVPSFSSESTGGRISISKGKKHFQGHLESRLGKVKTPVRAQELDLGQEE